MTTNDIFNLILSIVTIAIAIIALCQTHKQTKLSNKQQLFDRRLNCFIKLTDLYRLVKDNQVLLKEDDVVRFPEMSFALFTNVSYLEECAGIMKEPLEYKTKKIFLTKCEMILSLAEESKFIWDKKISSSVENFFKCYTAFLRALHRQKICLNHLKDEKEEMRFQDGFTEEQNKAIYKKYSDISKILEATKELQESYNVLNNNQTLTILEKQISL